MTEVKADVGTGNYHFKHGHTARLLGNTDIFHSTGGFSEFNKEYIQKGRFRKKVCIKLVEEY